MKKRQKTVFMAPVVRTSATALFLLSLLSPLSLKAQTPVTDESNIETIVVDGQTIKVDRSLYPDFDLTPAPSRPPYAVRRARNQALVRRGLATASQLPDHVNNAETKYYPPVFNQDGGSCGSAQNIGYDFTYEMDCYRDLDASLPENQYPTHFTWLLTYHNSGKEEMARANGIPNVPTYGGRTYSRLFGNQTHDDDDFGWMQGYDKWYSAMWNRSAGSFAMSSPTNTPEGRQELKEYFYNHCGDESLPAGGIVGIGCAAYGTWAKIPATANNKAIGVNGMSYIKAWGDTYNHAITICGYDDRIEFDLDGDGKIGEVDEDEVGAWIVCNSWGEGWENNGFIYCPYKYSYSVLTDQMPWTPTSHIIRRDYRPLRTIRIRMDYSHRSELKLSAGVSENLSAEAPDNTIEFEHFKNAGNHSNLAKAPEVPMLGHWADGMHYEPMEFGYDLTDLTATVDRNKPLKYFFIIESKSNAVGTGNVYDCTFINYEFEKEGVEIPFDMDGTVAIQNKGKKTIITVIVPGEQIYPPRNLALTDGILSWDAPQPSGLPLSSYYIYEGGELIDSVPATTLTYDPIVATGASFTVKAVYSYGGLLHISEPTNGVAPLPEPSTDNRVIEFKKGGMSIPNAIDEPLSQATIEFWMRCDTHVSYNQQMGPGWGTFLFHTDNNGRLVVGWNTGSNERMEIASIFNNKAWKHIAITINNNVMTTYVNGVKKGAITCKTYSGLSAFGELKFGHSGDNQQWTGAIDEFRVWKTVRSLEAIKADMKSEIANPSAQRDLMLYLRMDTINVGGKTYIQELVSGKHARPLSMGSWNIANAEDLLTGRTSDFNASIEGDNTGVVGLPVSLKAVTPVDAVSWQWHAEGADVTDAKSFDPVLTYSKAGTYEVTLTATSLGGDTAEATTTVTIGEAKAPVAAFDIPSATLPAGDRFSFINRSTGDGCLYTWSMPGAEVESATGTNATALYPTLGTFTVTLTATNSIGSSTVSKEVTVTSAAPNARFTLSENAILLGDTVRLIDESRYQPTAWSWQLSNGHRAFTVNGPRSSICPKAPGFYDITLTASNALGQHSISKGHALTVSNADAGTALHFTGNESIAFASPLKDGGSFTLDWWMMPSGSNAFTFLRDDASSLSLTVAADGSMTAAVDGNTFKSDAGFIVGSEWHHYALIYDADANSITFERDCYYTTTLAVSANTLQVKGGQLTVGMKEIGFSGFIDEFRIWGKALDDATLKTYANAPIADTAAAESQYALGVYYDFNQTGGDVIDRSSCGRNATRIEFGPDGDAWNSALGVFTLDLEFAPAGDITARYLTNYQRPYLTSAGSVNTNNTGRFLRLQMGTEKSGWKEAGAYKNGGIITGAHVDTEHGRDITIETKWSGFAETLSNYRLWQTTLLPAGSYTFSCKLSDGTDAQNCVLVACYGDDMLTNDTYRTEAIAWSPLLDQSISFMIDKPSKVSLGVIVNMSGQLCLSFREFHLEGFRFDNIDVIYDSPALNTLSACIDSLTADGTDFNRPVYLPSTTDAWFTALRNAQSLLFSQEGTEEEFTAAAKALVDAHNAIAFRPAPVDGYYFIDSALPLLFPKGLYALPSSMVAWNNVDRTNPAFLWELSMTETTSDGFHGTIRNVATGEYLDAIADGIVTLATSGLSSVRILAPLSDATYALRSTDCTADALADGMEGGYGVGGCVLGTFAEDVDGTATSWTLVPATEEEQAAILRIFEHADANVIDCLRPADQDIAFTDANPLITDESQISTNYPGVGRSKLSSLIDGKTSYYQTQPASYTAEEIVAAEKPYFQLALPRLVSKLWLYTRAYNATNTSMRPFRITLSTSDDGENWTAAKVILNIPNAVPQNDVFKKDNDIEWTSPLVDLGTPCRYVRVIVDEVNYRNHTGVNNNLYNDFSLSELQLYDADPTVGVLPLSMDEAAPQLLYTPDGRCVGTSTDGLLPGLYIQRGRKIIVK